MNDAGPTSHGGYLDFGDFVQRNQARRAIARHRSRSAEVGDPCAGGAVVASGEVPGGQVGRSLCGRSRAHRPMRLWEADDPGNARAISVSTSRSWRKPGPSVHGKNSFPQRLLRSVKNDLPVVYERCHAQLVNGEAHHRGEGKKAGRDVRVLEIARPNRSWPREQPPSDVKMSSSNRAGDRAIAVPMEGEKLLFPDAGVHCQCVDVRHNLDRVSLLRDRRLPTDEPNRLPCNEGEVVGSLQRN